MHLERLALALLLAAGAAHAQLADANPDWKESEAPAPPALRTTGLVPLEIPGSQLRFGVDPASVSLGSDGVVRYVVVAASAGGAVNGIYEGIRCSTGEYKVYARNSGKGWSISGSDWRLLHDQPRSRHSLLVARTGACIGRGPNRSAAQIVRDLRAPAADRFERY
ncbi:MAG TPA: CNP1-like family protein [Ramlibacter sp.]